MARGRPRRPWRGRSCSCSQSPGPCRCRAARRAGSQRPGSRASRPGRPSQWRGRRWPDPRSTAPSGSCSTSVRCWRRSPCSATGASLRAVEPALAAGALIVIGYGLAGRLRARDPRAEPILRGGRPPRAAAHLLERGRPPRGDRAGALCPAGGRSDPVAQPPSRCGRRLRAARGRGLPLVLARRGGGRGARPDLPARRGAVPAAVACRADGPRGGHPRVGLSPRPSAGWPRWRAATPRRSATAPSCWC